MDFASQLSFPPEQRVDRTARWVPLTTQLSVFIITQTIGETGVPLTSFVLPSKYSQITFPVVATMFIYLSMCTWPHSLSLLVSVAEE